MAPKSYVEFSFSDILLSEKIQRKLFFFKETIWTWKIKNRNIFVPINSGMLKLKFFSMIEHE